MTIRSVEKENKLLNDKIQEENQGNQMKVQSKKADEINGLKRMVRNLEAKASDGQTDT